jgi:hypothetical protein
MPQERLTVPAVPAHPFGHSVGFSGTRQHEAAEGNLCRGAPAIRTAIGRCLEHALKIVGFDGAPVRVMDPDNP